MPQFLIEVPHEDDHEACVRALHALEQYGSHWVTHADFGCSDGCHCGWMTVEVDDRDGAIQIVPPEFRAVAKIVRLQKFTREKIKELMEEYEG